MSYAEMVMSNLNLNHLNESEKPIIDVKIDNILNENIKNNKNNNKKPRQQQKKNNNNNNNNNNYKIIDIKSNNLNSNNGVSGSNQIGLSPDYQNNSNQDYDKGYSDAVKDIVLKNKFYHSIAKQSRNEDIKYNCIWRTTGVNSKKITFDGIDWIVSLESKNLKSFITFKQETSNEKDRSYPLVSFDVNLNNEKQPNRQFSLFKNFMPRNFNTYSNELDVQMTSSSLDDFKIGGYLEFEIYIHLFKNNRVQL